MVHGCVRDVITKNLANRRKNAKSKLDGSRDTRRSRGDETTARARVRIRMPDVRDDVPILIDFRAGTAERERRTRIPRTEFATTYVEIFENFHRMILDDTFEIMENRDEIFRIRMECR